MTKENDTPPAAGDGAGGAGDNGGPGFSIDELNRLIDARAEQIIAARTSSAGAGAGTPAGGGAPPAPPSVGGASAGDGGIPAGALEAAIARALDSREQRDSTAYLAEELEKFKTEVAGKLTTPRARRNWASILLGQGVGRGY